MNDLCPHCGWPVGEPWHQRLGLQKLEKGWVELGVPVVGRVNLRRQRIVMVYFCEKTRMPFLLALKAAG